ncbi:hypothetical protein ACLOJK_006115 [Asimina triloba]
MGNGRQSKVVGIEKAPPLLISTARISSRSSSSGGGGKLDVIYEEDNDCRRCCLEDATAKIQCTRPRPRSGCIITKWWRATPLPEARDNHPPA